MKGVKYKEYKLGKKEKYIGNEKLNKSKREKETHKALVPSRQKKREV